MTEFRSRQADLAEAGIAIFGISVDSIFCHQAFDRELGGLPYPLLADFERTMVEAYGVRRDDVDGFKGMPNRSVFIVDSDGVIRWTWLRRQEQPLPDHDAVVGAAKEVAGLA